VFAAGEEDGVAGVDLAEPCREEAQPQKPRIWEVKCTKMSVVP